MQDEVEKDWKERHGDLKKSTIVPGMRTIDPILLLFGKTRYAVLRLLYGKPDERYYLRELSRRLGISPGALQREMMLLCDAGLVVRDRHRFYSANSVSPFFKPILDIIRIADVQNEHLLNALRRITVEVQCAFVFGSFARGGVHAESDLDLFIISASEIQMPELMRELTPVEASLGREVNPFAITAAEFRGRLASGNPFLLRILSEKKMFLIGDQHELDRLAKERVASAVPVEQAGNRRAARDRRTRSEGLPDAGIGG